MQYAKLKEHRKTAKNCFPLSRHLIPLQSLLVSPPTHLQFINLLLPLYLFSFPHCRKNQQYDSKWYIPLTELTFQGPEETEPLTIPQVPDEELDAMKVKISHLRSEIQREKVLGCTLPPICGY